MRTLFELLKDIYNPFRQKTLFSLDMRTLFNLDISGRYQSKALFAEDIFRVFLKLENWHKF